MDFKNVIFQEYPYNVLKFICEAYTLEINDFKESINEDDVIYCVSDYAGDTKEDINNTYSFVFITKQELNKFILDIWGFAGDNKVESLSFFEFKKFKKDKVRKRLLPNFLDMISKVNALSITVMTDKFFMNQDGNPAEILKENIDSNFPSHLAHRIIDICQIQTFFIALLSNGNHYVWYTDRDAMFDTIEKKEGALTLLKHHFKFFNVNIKNKKFGLRVDDGKSMEGHILAVPDLLLGAYNDIINSNKNKKDIKDYSKLIFEWSKCPDSSFKKIIYSIKHENSEKIRMKNLLNYSIEEL